MKKYLIIVLFLSSMQSFSQDSLSLKKDTSYAFAIGDTLPDFVLPNLEWDEITLSKINKKVVLVDFWASWCRYCRVFNQEISDLKFNYGKDGFEIISVSLDTDYYKWKKAVQTDELDWINVNAKEGYKSDIISTFKIKQTPTTFLINKDKIIFGINLEGEELENAIKELLK